MIRCSYALTKALSGGLCIVVLMLITSAPGLAQESVTVSLPPTVTFNVGSVYVSSPSVPTSTLVQFSSAVLIPLRVLRISVIADTANFSGSGGTPIPATAVSWTVSNASGGVGSSGQLSAGAYTQIFQTPTFPTSGSFNVTWTLAAPGASVRAGTHTLSLRWKLEAVFP